MRETGRAVSHDCTGVQSRSSAPSVRRLSRRNVGCMNQAPLQQPMQRVVVTDVNMTFGSMVLFMVKWAIASIPAMILLAGIGALVTAVLFAFLAALGIAASSH